MRTWEPGAIVAGLIDGNEVVGMVRGGGRRMFYADSVTTDQIDLKHVRNLRPLAVIDPEDLEQVERFRRLIQVPGLNGFSAMSHWQAVLREFAEPKPVKPPEPMGLGAVVEDNEGRRWVRDIEDGTRYESWFHAPASRVSRRDSWQNIDVVTVLSEGIS